MDVFSKYNSLQQMLLECVCDDLIMPEHMCSLTVKFITRWSQLHCGSWALGGDLCVYQKYTVYHWLENSVLKIAVCPLLLKSFHSLQHPHVIWILAEIACDMSVCFCIASGLAYMAWKALLTLVNQMYCLHGYFNQCPLQVITLW